MSSSFLLLEVESRDFSHAEKQRTACKAEQIHKMTTTLKSLIEEHAPHHSKVQKDAWAKYIPNFGFK